MIKIKYRVLPILLACTALIACIDDDLPTCIDETDSPEMFTDGYSLNLIVTLDPMGGTTRVGEATGREAQLEALESYIDPEKFRVLFFDREERFLFESKSRWVKKIVPNNDNDHSEWFVSVPIYAYGNDESEDWNWKEIRRVLTGEDMEEDLENYPDKKDPSYKYNYDVEVIKKVIAGELQHAFKIAVLVNRPKKEWNMGINGRYNVKTEKTVVDNGKNVTIEMLASGSDIGIYAEEGDKLVLQGDPTAPITPNGWAIENGPRWKSRHTRWGTNVKKVIDLHHCQYDPVYEGKSYNDRDHIFEKYTDKYNECDVFGVYYGDGDDNTAASSSKGKAYENGDKSYKIGYKNHHVYDFVAGTIEEGEGFEGLEGELKMGASSTWIDWSGEDGKYNGNANKSAIGNFRYFVPPTEDHPIPMYGIQDFYKIKDWVKGTPFNLSKTAKGQDEDADDYEYRTISLLRSVVKLELVLPSGTNPQWVIMYYPNVYARCEPMNVWTPTNEIWEEEADDLGTSTECEELKTIKKYGPVANTSNYGSTDDTDASINYYINRLSWFYGEWKENGPDGKPRHKHEKFNPATTSHPYPKIFNSYIQRVQGAVCYDKTERPYGSLFYQGSDGKEHYVVYVGERNINDPTNLMRVGNNANGAYTICYWQIRHGQGIYSIALAPEEENQGKQYKSYRYEEVTNPNRNMGVTNQKDASKNYEYEQGVRDKSAAMPWPLLRNHVYKITVGGMSANTRSGDEGVLSMKSEDLYSKSIKFDKPRKETKEKEKVTEKK